MDGCENRLPAHGPGRNRFRLAQLYIERQPDRAEKHVHCRKEPPLPQAPNARSQQYRDKIEGQNVNPLEPVAQNEGFNRNLTCAFQRVGTAIRQVRIRWHAFRV